MVSPRFQNEAVKALRVPAVATPYARVLTRGEKAQGGKKIKVNMIKIKAVDRR